MLHTSLGGEGLEGMFYLCERKGVRQGRKLQEEGEKSIGALEAHGLH